MSEGAIVVFAGVALTLVAAVLALAGGAPPLRKRADTVRRRAKGETTTAVAMQAATSVKRAEGRSVPLVEELAKRYLPRQSALRERLARTGYTISIGTYVLVSAGVGAAVFVAVWLASGLPPTASALAGAAVGIALPHVVVGLLTARRQRRFLASLPDAVDLIIRGLRSGLPVTEGIAVVGREMPDPLGAEFRTIADSVRFGRPLEETLWDTARRLSLAEFNFFVISLSVQRETGGNLGETLANLTDILRKRRQMKLKIKAMSSEARASAMILGSLPFVMFGIVQWIDPAYANDLLTDPRGIMMTVAGCVSMLIGILVMKKMVSFEI